MMMEAMAQSFYDLRGTAAERESFLDQSGNIPKLIVYSGTIKRLAPVAPMVQLCDLPQKGTTAPMLVSRLLGISWSQSRVTPLCVLRSLQILGSIEI